MLIDKEFPPLLGNFAKKAMISRHLCGGGRHRRGGGGRGHRRCGGAGGGRAGGGGAGAGRLGGRSKSKVARKKMRWQ